MQTQNTTTAARKMFSTEQAAEVLHVKPQTLRAAICRDGHYYGIRPNKARNRFLLWPADAVERLTAPAAAA